MDVRALLTDAFGRIPGRTRKLLDGLDPDHLHARPDRDANHLAWLLWHTARMADEQVADLAGREPVWTADGWVERFDLPLDAGDHGYGHTPAQVAQVRVADPALLADYQDAVSTMIDGYLAGVDADDLDRVVDDSYDPPVTAGVRLVSVVGDAMQHLGQAGYLRGLLERGVAR